MGSLYYLAESESRMNSLFVIPFMVKPFSTASLANISPNDGIGRVFKFSFCCCILLYPGLLFFGALSPELIDASDTDSSWVTHLVKLILCTCGKCLTNLLVFEPLQANGFWAL
ncbi:unnamed protein product [Diatraea saccharalis]|uniref:Uncharacterized protein n=1 Tax=Diatraea saccharalis TaxID=40085 RepID=A0A9N9RBL1_9NEOP|nr:unnamed protein product [Diatraea saccharalis]